MSAVRVLLTSIYIGFLYYIIAKIIGKIFCFVIDTVMKSIKKNNHQEIDIALKRIDNALADIIEQIEKNRNDKDTIN